MAGLLLLSAGCRASGAAALLTPSVTVARGVARTTATQPATTAVMSSTTPLAASPTATAAPTHTATTTHTPLPGATATPTPSPSPTHPVTPSSTPSPTPPACPEEPPIKPEYDNNSLTAEPWPIPDPAWAGAHFWLARPFERSDRVLFAPTYSYGSDGNGRYLLHNGIDIAQPKGTPLLAPADGLVVVAGEDREEWYGWRCDWYGHLVVIRIDQTWQGQPVYALYGHVGNLAVRPGQRVRAGQKVAEVSVGGVATHPHLHLEVRVGQNRFGSTRNPLLWLQPGPSRGIIAGRLIDPDGHAWQGIGVSIAGGPDGAIFNTTSYLGDPQALARPDEGLAENFVFGDLPPGRYRLEARVQGEVYSATLEVVAGEITTVEIVTVEAQSSATEFYRP